MLDHTDNINLDKIVLTVKILKGDCGFVWDKPVQDLHLFFYPNFL